MQRTNTPPDDKLRNKKKRLKVCDKGALAYFPSPRFDQRMHEREKRNKNKKWTKVTSMFVSYQRTNEKEKRHKNKQWTKVTSMFVSLTPKQSGCRHTACTVKYIKCNSYNSQNK
jgi:hypothetical protein